MATAAPAHAARDHCLAPARSGAPGAEHAGKYGRLFPELEPYTCDEPFLLALGRAGGACDGGPFAAQGSDDAEGAAGWPFFGQFVAHDITSDRSPLVLHADTDAIRNFRSPRANLECVYGAGMLAPYLYQRDDPAKLLLGAGGSDLPRNGEGIALIGDPRNDVHLVVAQLQLALLKAHNRIVDRLRDDGESPAGVFEEARRATTWHYQWIALRDFLPRAIGAELADELLRDGPQVYRPDGDPYIPFEFADAAYRYGHSQIRHAFRLQDGEEPVPFFPDLLGFRPVERDLDWSYLFDLPGRPAKQRAKKIDGRLPASLMNLPLAITGDVDREEFHSLAVRDLQRGQALELPSGESVARRLGAVPLTSDEVGLAGAGWEGQTPLWYYVLREADVRENGECLGPVGGRIVGEVLVGIVDADPESFRALDPSWRPTIPHEGETFGLGDLLAFAAG